jgi:hypothetical protein
MIGRDMRAKGKAGWRQRRVIKPVGLFILVVLSCAVTYALLVLVGR